MLATKWMARAVTACAIGIMAVPQGAASADTKAYDDPVGDATSVDISRVRVAHRAALTVRVRSDVPLKAGQVYTFWIDAGRGPRSTYHVSFRPNSDEGRLGIVRAFGGKSSRFVECSGMQSRADIFSDAPVSVRIPRGCLGNPERVRVAVRFADESTGDLDWAPKSRAFGPWVAR
jgi:hypothetical protein